MIDPRRDVVGAITAADHHADDAERRPAVRSAGTGAGSAGQGRAAPSTGRPARRRHLFAAGWAAVLPLLAQRPAQAAGEKATDSRAGRGGPVHIVYHIDDAALQATRALRNLRNHLHADPSARIRVVALAAGVDFLMEGARDPHNADIDYASLVSFLTARGVVFEVCETTLGNRGLEQSAFIMDATFTPSGVARIGQLQWQEGYAYLKP